MEFGPSLEAGKGRKMDSPLDPPERKAALPVSCFQPSEMHFALLDPEF